jgi:hypothetical protein
MQSGKMRKQGLSGKRHAGHGSGHASGRVVAERDVRIGVFRQPAMHTPVLVLNASYEPINICGARRALVLVLKGVARTEEEQPEEYSAARQKRLPVLQCDSHRGRADARSCDSSFAGRTFDVGEPGGLLPQLQPAQGQPDAARTDRYEAAARAETVLPAYVAAYYADDRQRGRGVAEVPLLRGRAGGLGAGAWLHGRGYPPSPLSICKWPGIMSL